MKRVGPHSIAAPIAALIVTLLAAGCDDARPRSGGESEGPGDAGRAGDGAPPESGRDAAPDTGLDAAPDAVVDPGPADATQVMLVARLDDGRLQLIAFDPHTGRAEPWGAPIPLEADWTLHEVMHDVALDRVVVRYGFPPVDPRDRRSNFAYAGYLRAARDGDWQTIAHTDDVIALVLAPTLEQMALVVHAQGDPELCTENRLLDFAGRTLLDSFDPAAPCDAQRRVWGFGPDYRVVRQRDDMILIDDAGEAPLDLGDTRVAWSTRLLALPAAGPLVRVSKNARWHDRDGAIREIIEPDAYLIFDGHTFHDGALWAIGDGTLTPLDAADAPFVEARPGLAPLADRPDVEGSARRLWLRVVDGRWTAALIDGHFLSPFEEVPDGDEVNRSVYDAWHRDPQTGAWRRSRLFESSGPVAPWVVRAGRYLLWADACAIARFDTHSGVFDRLALDWPVIDAAVGRPGWWGGLDRGHGRAGRDATGQPVVEFRGDRRRADCPAAP